MGAGSRQVFRNYAIRIVQRRVFAATQVSNPQQMENRLRSAFLLWILSQRRMKTRQRRFTEQSRTDKLWQKHLLTLGRIKNGSGLCSELYGGALMDQAM